MMPKYKQAVVFGAGGFIGRTLVRYLKHCGMNVLAVDCSDVDFLGVQCEIADISEFNGLNVVTKHLHEDRSGIVVFQLAGMSHAGSNREQPVRAWNVNVTGTLHVLEWCRNIGIRRIVYPSSSLVYGETINDVSRESDPVAVTSVYTASKVAVEDLLKAYDMEFGICYSIARLGNVYGYGAAEDSLIAILLRQAVSNGGFSVRTLRPVRDFIYVEDVVTGLATLAEKSFEGISGVYNLGTAQATSVENLIQLLCRIIQVEVPVEEHHPSADTTRIVLDIGKIERECLWRPRWSLENGLSDTLRQMRS